MMEEIDPSNTLELTEQAAPVYQPRNFLLGVVNGVLYIVSEALLDPTLVLVAFVGHLTHSPFLLGLILPIRDGAWALPQLWVSGFVQNLPKKIVYYRKISYVRMAAWFSIAFAITFIHDPAWLLIIFFLAYTVASLASGLSGLPFLEAVGKTVQPRRRGEFFAWRFGLGGLFSIGASALVTYLLDTNSPLIFPQNFSLLAFLYAILGSIALLAYNGVDEPDDVVLHPPAPITAQFKRALTFLSHHTDYRRYLTMQSFLLISAAATPFFAVYMQKRLGGPSEMVGVYLSITIVSNLISNIIFGRLSFNRGNRIVLVFSAIAGTVMSGSVVLIALLAKPMGISGLTASYLLIPIFILSGIRGTGIGVSSNSMLLDITPPGDRSLYIGFTNTILGLVILATSLGGVIVSTFGYEVLFVATLLTHIAAWIAVQKTGRITDQTSPSAPD